MPQISIIVPVYNAEEYLHRCFDSILNQTFTDFELILVDDGSTDRSGEICDEYAKNDKRITVIHKRNGGQAAARNSGLDIAKGDYIGFVDSDDWIHPQMYEILLECCKKHNADVSIGKYVRCNEYQRTDLMYNVEKEILNSTTYDSNEIFNNYYFEHEYLIPVLLWIKLYKKSIFKEVRLREEGAFEDDQFVFPLILNTKKIAFVNTVMYYYFNNYNSVMHKPFNVKNYIMLDIVNERCEYMRHNKIQYDRSKSSFYKEYVSFGLITKLYKKEYKKVFRKYSSIFVKDFIHIIRNKEICNMLKLIIFLVHISPKYTLKLCRRYFDDIPSYIQWLLRDNNVII